MLCNFIWDTFRSPLGSAKTPAQAKIEAKYGEWCIPLREKGKKTFSYYIIRTMHASGNEMLARRTQRQNMLCSGVVLSHLRQCSEGIYKRWSRKRPDWWNSKKKKKQNNRKWGRSPIVVVVIVAVVVAVVVVQQLTSQLQRYSVLAYVCACLSSFVAFSAYSVSLFAGKINKRKKGEKVSYFIASVVCENFTVLYDYSQSQ